MALFALLDTVWVRTAYRIMTLASNIFGGWAVRPTGTEQALRNGRFGIAGCSKIYLLGLISTDYFELDRAHILC